MLKDREIENFSGLGNDLKKARKVLGLSRRVLAEMVNIDPRYLANIENSGSLPSLPVFDQLVKICKLPVEQYFFPVDDSRNDADRLRTVHKLELCPRQYLPIIEAALDGAIGLDTVTDRARDTLLPEPQQDMSFSILQAYHFTESKDNK